LEVEETGKKILIMNAILLVLDFIWLVTMGSVWSSASPSTTALDPYSGIHSFALFMSWINFLVRLAVIGGLAFMVKDKLLAKKSGPGFVEGTGYDMNPIAPPRA
jgi:hypothetical protein